VAFAMKRMIWPSAEVVSMVSLFILDGHCRVMLDMAY
jgi:hypothetical protein